VHGDIKGVCDLSIRMIYFLIQHKANILITDEFRACLADFGLALAIESQVLNTSSAGSSRGTLRWLAPEVLDSSRKPERQSLLTKRDIYAFACTLLEVLFQTLPKAMVLIPFLQIYSGSPPFPTLKDVEVIHRVITKRDQPEIPANSDPLLKDLKPLLKRCWHNNPRQRPTATEVSDIIQLDPSQWRREADSAMSRFPSMLRKLSLGSPTSLSTLSSGGRRTGLATPSSSLSPTSSDFSLEKESNEEVKILLLGPGKSGKVCVSILFCVSSLM
jgi:hypothetical protein